MTNELDFFSYITVIYLLEFRILVGLFFLSCGLSFVFPHSLAFFGKEEGGSNGN